MNISFEQQMELYENQIKQGIDPLPNQNLFDLEKEGQPKVEKYSGPYQQMFDEKLIEQLVSLKWQDRLTALKSITDNFSQYQGHEKLEDTLNHLLDKFTQEKNT